MAEKNVVYKGKVKQKGIFDFKDFYQFMYNHMMDENYDVFEDKYWVQIEPGDSRKIELTWKARKEISNYFRYDIEFEWIILRMKKIKVRKEDKEIQMDTGTPEIRFTAVLVKDYDNKWNTPFLKFLRRIYDKYVIRTRIEDHELKLYQEVTEALAQAKSFLSIEGQHDIP